ncbi:MAG: hypothetical protein AB8C02_13745 [Halioglobus sp.]
MGRGFAFSCALWFSFALTAQAGPREQAKTLHDRLTGVPPSEEMLSAMESVIDGPQGRVTAALYAIDGAPGVTATGDFYTVVLKNWVSPWTNESQDVFAPLNDYSAMVIGLVRDEGDFREILSGDILYTGSGSTLPAYTGADNTHFEALERSGANLGDSSVLVRGTQTAAMNLPAQAVAGVMSTRAAARSFYVDGTNRAMLRFTLLNHLCMDLEQLKDSSAPSDRIRQDVSRSPGGDSTLFLNGCVSCHAGMDPLAQAFAFYDFPYPSAEEAPNLELEARKDLGQMVYTPGQVQRKYGINSATFAPGYVTSNDHWTNYWRLGENTSRVGWRGTAGNDGAVDMARNPAYAEGDGAASLGRELADTEAFSYCQVEKAFKSVCLRDPVAMTSDTAAVDGAVNTFNTTFNMKQVFAEVASYCVGDL